MQPAVVLFRTVCVSAVFSLAAVALPASAQVSLNITVAPPAPRYEPAPVLRPGYVWAPGYWAWNGGRYDWVRGHQIARRPGHRWVPDHWESGNRYRAGYWAPDRGFEGRRDEHRYGERGYRHEHGREHHDEHGRDRGHGDHFCPPGQAKKGNC